MGKIKEVKFTGNISVEEYIEKQKQNFKKMFKTDNVKFVGITFYFLIDGEMLSTIELNGEGFNPEDFEE